jgi:hypothetical protein
LASDRMAARSEDENDALTMPVCVDKRASKEKGDAAVASPF